MLKNVPAVWLLQVCTHSFCPVCRDTHTRFTITMACSKQASLDSFFGKRSSNTVDSQHEPEAKKYRTFTRNYDPSYIKFGFISSDGHPPKPICVICQTMLSNEAMKPSKLSRHLETKHPNLKDKSEDFFKRKSDELATQTKILRSNLTENEKLTKASYLISHHIAKCQAPFTIGEKLIMPSIVTACSEVLSPAAAAKVKEVPLSNDTVCRRIDDMAADIEMQTIERAKSSDWFAIQLDETTDIANLAMLLVYIRYAHAGRFHEDFLFCKALPGTTTAGDIFSVLDGYISGHGLMWERCVGVCTDGAAAMTGRHNGVVARVKAVSPSVQATHCVIHREVLASKRLSAELHEVLNQVVKIVNFIKANPTHSRLFTALCDEMGADHVQLLLHSEVRWLSRGKVVNRVYELRHEIEAFLTNKQSNLANHLRDKSWIIKVAYLSDILDHFNMLNLSIQGQACDIFQANDKIMAFKKKLSVWTNRVNRGVFDMFGCLSSLADEGEDLGEVPAMIAQHLAETLRHFDNYFPSKSYLTDKQWVRDPFTNPETSDLPPVVQDKLLELSCDAGLQSRFSRLSLSEFWLSCCDEYPQLSEMALKTMMPFHSTYLCETAFSHLTATKTKYRNRLNSENTLRVSLSPCLPRFDLLVARKQAHPSH